jgi:hypothetical protein
MPDMAMTFAFGMERRISLMAGRLKHLPEECPHQTFIIHDEYSCHCRSIQLSGAAVAERLCRQPRYFLSSICRNLRASVGWL